MGKKKENVMEIDLLCVLKALWHRAWILVLAMVLGGALAFGGTWIFLKPAYQASVLMYVNSSDLSVGGAKTSISQGELSAAKSLVGTYAVILKSRTTLNVVIAQSGVSYSYEDLRDMITATSVNSTEVFKIEVEMPDPAEAVQVANTIAQVLPEKIAAIVEGSSVRIVDMAVEPTQKASPSYVDNTFLGGLLGFVLAAGILIVLELMDDKIHGTDDLTGTCDLPVLAVIPDLRNTRNAGYASCKKPAKGPSGDVEQAIGGNLSFGAAEAYKLLRTNLDFRMPRNNGCQIIGITSPLRGEGKSTTAINTAYAMAQTGKKVLLLEADMRLPGLGKRLGEKQTPGLSNLLAGQCSGKNVLQKSKRCKGLWLVAAGDVPPNPTELLGSERMRLTMDRMAAVFDVILLDLPPVAVVSDALVVSRLVDGMVLVVRQDYCDQASVQEAIRQLQFADARILGLVMTDADMQAKHHRRRNGAYNPRE